MQNSRLLRFVPVSLILIAPPVCPVTAQTGGEKALSEKEAVRLALEKSPAVVAARSRLEAASAELRGARAPYGLQAEAAPGAGFTNGAALLSYRLDVSGRRVAASHQATGEHAAAAATLDSVRLQVAAEARMAYYDLARAQAALTTATEALEVVQQLRDAVRRRVELGQEPQVHATRADIEMARAEQEVVRVRGDAQARLSTLNLLLGRMASEPLVLTDTLILPPAPAATQELIRQAMQVRPDMKTARARIHSRLGAVGVARAQGRPDLYAEVASDIWSLDRDSPRARNLGFQLRLAFPLADGGALRANIDRARALVREQEAELATLQRSIAIGVERAAAELAAVREVVGNYQQTILPRTADLLRASRSGFETGLTSFLEVLEAQRVSRQTQNEYQTALFDALRAHVALERELGAAPGFAPAKP